MLQAAEASGSEEEAPAEADGQEEGEIVAPQTPADKKAQRLAARRAAMLQADAELKVCLTLLPAAHSLRHALSLLYN